MVPPGHSTSLGVNGVEGPNLDAGILPHDWRVCHKLSAVLLFGPSLLLDFNEYAVNHQPSCLVTHTCLSKLEFIIVVVPFVHSNCRLDGKQGNKAASKPHLMARNKITNKYK